MRASCVLPRGPADHGSGPSARDPETPTSGRRLDIYDGRHRLGTVHLVDARGGAVAVLPDGRQLGPFDDMATARVALRDEARRR